MKIIYVSGPIVGNASKKNVQKVIKANMQTAEKFVTALANNGVGFFSPHLNTVKLTGKTLQESQKYYYELDTEFLIRIADAIVVLPGWETSFGVRNEIKIAKELGLPTFYPKSPEDLDEILEWYNKASETEEPTKAKENVDWDKVIDIRHALSKYKFG